jgi:hypothetical protein
VLLGRDIIDAAVNEELVAGEQAGLAVEGELEQGDRIGAAGLVVLTADRLLFASEPVTGKAEVRAWELAENACHVRMGFLGPELHVGAEGGPSAVLRRFSQADFDALHRTLVGAPAAEPELEWTSLAQAAPAPAVVEASPEPVIEPAAPTAAARRRQRKQAREAREAKPESRQAEAAPAASSSKGGGFLGKLIWAGVAVGVALGLGAWAGDGLATSQVAEAQTPEALQSLKKVYDTLADTLQGGASLFFVYFIISTAILLATNKGRKLRARGLFVVNMLTLYSGMFSNALLTSGQSVIAKAAEEAPPAAAETEKARAEPQEQAAPAEAPAKEEPGSAAASPEAGQGSEEQSAGLSSAQVDRVVAPNKRRLEACVKRFATEASSGLSLQLTVAPSGKVTALSVNGERDGSRLLGCIGRFARAWRFPSFAGEAVEVEVPLVE